MSRVLQKRELVFWSGQKLASHLVFEDGSLSCVARTQKEDVNNVVVKDPGVQILVTQKNRMNGGRKYCRGSRVSRQISQIILAF